MLRKLLLSPWFGPLPPWWEKWLDSASRLGRYGYDVRMPTDLRDFTHRVAENLRTYSSVTRGSAKIHDYRPALAAIYPDLIEGYDFWGHTDLDVVYGRVGEFWPDDLLEGVDAVSDHSHYLCGPFALYRPHLADAFRADPNWRDQLEDTAVSGWVETDFTRLLNESGARVAYRQSHGYLHPELARWDGDRLMEGDVERSFFHFRHTKHWPAGLA